MQYLQEISAIAIVLLSGIVNIPYDLQHFTDPACFELIQTFWNLHSPSERLSCFLSALDIFHNQSHSVSLEIAYCSIFTKVIWSQHLSKVLHLGMLIHWFYIYIYPFFSITVQPTGSSCQQVLQFIFIQYVVYEYTTYYSMQYMNTTYYSMQYNKLWYVYSLQTYHLFCHRAKSLMPFPIECLFSIHVFIHLFKASCSASHLFSIL